MSPGRLVTFEGGEAAGKSTQIRLLAERLQADGHRVVVVREPGGTPVGEKIRELLKHAPESKGIEPSTELFLLSASRAELVAKVIRPALAEGTIVLMDRFFDSTLAYQGGGRGISRTALESVIGLSVGLTRPDLTFLLRASIEATQERLGRRNSSLPPVADHFEAEPQSFFAGVYEAYERLAMEEPDRFVTVDGNQSIDAVATCLWTILQSRLGLRSPVGMSSENRP